MRLPYGTLKAKVEKAKEYALPDGTRKMIEFCESIDREVQAFKRKTAAAEYTDTGEALELLSDLRLQARAVLRAVTGGTR